MIDNLPTYFVRKPHRSPAGITFSALSATEFSNNLIGHYNFKLVLHHRNSSCSAKSFDFNLIRNFTLT